MYFYETSEEPLKVQKPYASLLSALKCPLWTNFLKSVSWLSPFQLLYQRCKLFPGPPSQKLRLPKKISASLELGGQTFNL
jgi:hypothetical protein